MPADKRILRLGFPVLKANVNLTMQTGVLHFSQHQTLLELQPYLWAQLFCRESVLYTW